MGITVERSNEPIALAIVVPSNRHDREKFNRKIPYLLIFIIIQFIIRACTHTHNPCFEARLLNENQLIHNFFYVKNIKEKHIGLISNDPLPGVPLYTVVPLLNSSVFRVSYSIASWQLVGWTMYTRKTSRMVEEPR